MFESITLAITLQNEADTLKFGAMLSTVLVPGNVIFLEGDLGAGKTTCVRGFLRGLQFLGPVKSPTYTLVEEYDFDWGRVYHFDLYRMTSPEELEYIGLREYFTENAIIFVEWAERGQGILPASDLEINFEIQADHRNIFLKTNTEKGQKILLALKDKKNKGEIFV